MSILRFGSERTTHFDDFKEFLRAIDTSDIQPVK